MLCRRWRHTPWRCCSSSFLPSARLVRTVVGPSFALRVRHSHNQRQGAVGAAVAALLKAGTFLHASALLGGNLQVGGRKTWMAGGGFDLLSKAYCPNDRWNHPEQMAPNTASNHAPEQTWVMVTSPYFSAVAFMSGHNRAVIRK